MKWFKNTHEIIELVRQNEELKRGIGDIVLYIIEANKGREHICIENKEVTVIFSLLADWRNRIMRLDKKKTKKK